MQVRTLSGRYSSSRSPYARRWDADLVVEPLDESERDLVFRLAIGGDPIPMTHDHFGELLVGREPLPLQARRLFPRNEISKYLDS